MAKAGGIRLRGLLRTVHLWIGLTLFVVLAPLGLSGSLLVWDDDLDKLVHPGRYEAAAGELAPSAYLKAATVAFAGRAVPVQLRMPAEPGASVMVTGYARTPAAPGQRPPSLTAWIDPATARVIDVADPRQEPRGIIHRLHGNLMLPQNGRPVVGWLGVAMLISAITGLITWWPRGNPLRGMRWSRSPLALSNLHHLVGFWACIPLAILAFTGAYIAFPVLSPARGPERGAFAAPLPTQKTDADQALAAALGAAPAGARLASVTLPTLGEKPAWRFQLKAGDSGQISVKVDDAKGKARPRDHAPVGGPGGGDPFLTAMRKLHDGSSYGPVWRVVIALTGLAPTILGVTGVIVWLRRRKKTTPTAS